MTRATLDARIEALTAKLPTLPPRSADRARYERELTLLRLRRMKQDIRNLRRAA